MARTYTKLWRRLSTAKDVADITKEERFVGKTTISRSGIWYGRREVSITA
jgi:hypothetical protein